MTDNKTTFAVNATGEKGEAIRKLFNKVFPDAEEVGKDDPDGPMSRLENMLRDIERMEDPDVEIDDDGNRTFIVTVSADIYEKLGRLGEYKAIADFGIIPTRDATVEFAVRQAFDSVWAKMCHQAEDDTPDTHVGT